MTGDMHRGLPAFRIGLLAIALSSCALGWVAVGPAEARAARCGPPPLSSAQANLVAASQFIVIGVARDPASRLDAAIRNPDPDYVDLSIREIEVLKGDPLPTEINLRVYPRDVHYGPPMRELVQSLGRPAIYHLLHVDQESVGYYFAGYSPAALGAAEPSALDSVRREIARQQAILASWGGDPSWPQFQAVRTLVRALTAIRRTGRRGTEGERERQAAILRGLEALGVSAVPAMIAHMDDRRELAFHAISLVNHSPDAFERMRHYGPETVGDALAAILGQLTGQSFGQTYSGGSERERQAAVAGWRVYGAGLICRHQPAIAAAPAR
jgi:hypothetical protein